jgi:hypothetical protein
MSWRHSVEDIIILRIFRGNYQHVSTCSSRRRLGGNYLSKRIR